MVFASYIEKTVVNEVDAVISDNLYIDLTNTVDIDDNVSNGD
jgi:hypothetical protein